MRFRNPEIAQEQMQALAPGCTLRPTKSRQFDMVVEPCALKPVALFTINASSLHAQIPASAGYFGVTLPAAKGFSIKGTKGAQVYRQGQSHILHCEQPFDFLAENGCSVLAANFFVEGLNTYASALQQKDTKLEEQLSPKLSLHSFHGFQLKQLLMKTFANRHWIAEADDSQAVAIKELEAELSALFVLATTNPTMKPSTLGRKKPVYLKVAEDYLLQHLDQPATRDAIATETGVCIRTLSRAFMKFNGVGPMEFLRERRMEAAFLMLSGSTHEEARVTSVASNFGFGHLGRFSVAYRQKFGESPSQTLNS